jgi:hypothetical protein
MQSDSDWDWIIEPSAPTTITVYEEEEIEEVAVLYGPDGEVLRRFTDSRKQPMGFALKQVKTRRRKCRAE